MSTNPDLIDPTTIDFRVWALRVGASGGFLDQEARSELSRILDALAGRAWKGTGAAFLVTIDFRDIAKHVDSTKPLGDANRRELQGILLKLATYFEAPPTELDKWAAVHEQAKTITDFLEWCAEERIEPTSFASPLNLIHRYFNIDAAKLERERRELLETEATK